MGGAEYNFKWCYRGSMDWHICFIEGGMNITLNVGWAWGLVELGSVLIFIVCRCVCIYFMDLMEGCRGVWY